MIEVISDNIAHWYEMCNTIVIVIIAAMQRNRFVHCCLSFSNHHGITFVSNLLWLTPCNVKFKLFRT